VDFGDGKKLEQVGGVAVVRDCPAAINIRPANRLVAAIHRSELQYRRERSEWLNLEKVPLNWHVRFRSLHFQLKPTPFGHVGLFPEQAANWEWIFRLPFDLTGLKAINLFAYTGGTTMALATRGVQVVHVDSARNIVGWARENASLSSLQDAPIRWIVDDATTFLRREIRRGNRYAILVADPPAIGHANGKMTWQIERDLIQLMKLFAAVSDGQPTAILLSCHSAGIDAANLTNLAQVVVTPGRGVMECGTLDLTCRDGRALNSGHYFRWHR
jgi:23S rRNA (cytosine1962-C5)-methyltransferase